VSNGNQLGKSLSVGHIVATVGLIIGGFTFIYDLRESVAIQAFQLETVENRLERIVERTDDRFETIIDSLQRLEEKLDAMVLPNPVYQKAR
jgi:hypothetical protein